MCSTQPSGSGQTPSAGAQPHRTACNWQQAVVKSGQIPPELGLPCSRSLIVPVLLHDTNRVRQNTVCITCDTHRSHSALADFEGRGSLLKDACNPVLLGGMRHLRMDLTSHEGAAHCTTKFVLGEHNEQPIQASNYGQADRACAARWQRQQRTAITSHSYRDMMHQAATLYRCSSSHALASRKSSVAGSRFSRLAARQHQQCPRPPGRRGRDSGPPRSGG